MHSQGITEQFLEHQEGAGYQNTLVTRRKPNVKNRVADYIE